MTRFLLLIACSIYVAAFSQPRLVKDIATGDVATLSSLEGNNWTRFKNELYFTATSNFYGTELWKTDGTPEGTKMVVDLAPGSNSSSPASLTVVGDKLFFAASLTDRTFYPLTGTSLFTTDGTASGTKQVGEVRLAQYYVTSQFPKMMIAHKGLLYFTAFSSAAGYEVWKSDGTVAGTMMVKDINPGTASSRPTSATHLFHSTGDNLYFTATDGTKGLEIWKSDGTAGGTTILKEILAGSSNSVFTNTSFASIGNTLFFVAAGTNFGNTGLWMSDGSVAGTTLLDTGSLGSDAITIVAAWNGKVYFFDEDKLMKTADGTGAVEIILSNKKVRSRVAVPFHDKLYFLAADASYHIMSTDGTSAGTVSVMNSPNEYLQLGANEDLMAIIQKKTGAEFAHNLLVYDGTSPAQSLRDIDWIATSDFISPLPTINEKFVFASNDHTHGAEPWTTDGTSPGTILLGDINSGMAAIPRSLNSINDQLFFFTNEAATGFELWKTDGTSEGTQLVKDINPGLGSSGTNTQVLHKYGDLAIFNAKSATHAGVWRSDGTEAGTFLLTTPGVTFSIGHSAVIGNTFYFTTSSGNQLWKTDGTVIGTSKVKDLGASGVYAMCAIGNAILFTDGANNLWKSDGTTLGTAILKAIGPSNVGQFPPALFPIGNVAFFVGFGASNQGNELWKSDGTAAGTVMVKEIAPGLISGVFPLYEFIQMNGILYFIASTDGFDESLWRSDGTATGTYRVRAAVSGSPMSEIRTMAGAVDGTNLYFSARGSNGSAEIWKSDGTGNGTVEVKDIAEGDRSSFPEGPAVKFGDYVYFTAYDDESGRELWRTDGTEAGTKRVTDIFPGIVSSSIANLTVSAGKLFFTAQDPDHGTELWLIEQDIEPQIEQDITFQPVGTKFIDDPAFALVASSSSGLLVDFELISGPATLSGSVLTITGIGEVVVRATQGGNNQYFASMKEQTFMVVKHDQTINFTPIDDKTIDETPFNVSATASSGLPVVFEIISGPANISGSTITLNGTGEVTINASQAGNEIYNPSMAQQTFKVELVLGLEDQYSISIWPNPASSTVVVHASSAEFYAISLRDILGKEISSKSVETEETVFETAHLPRGIYIIQLRTITKAVTRKIILK